MLANLFSPLRNLLGQELLVGLGLELLPPGKEALRHMEELRASQSPCLLHPWLGRLRIFHEISRRNTWSDGGHASAFV